jgi:hypothetical protein
MKEKLKVLEMSYSMLKKLKIMIENVNKIMWCSYCKRSGHLRRTCYDLKYYCEYCKRNGHTSDRCYKRICKNCYQTGHDEKECKEVRNPENIMIKMNTLLEWYKEKNCQ